MKCSLTSIIQSLGSEFPIETRGDLNRHITDIQDFSESSPPSCYDVLYIIPQNRLLRYQGPPVRGVVLCVCHTPWDLGYSQAVFPSLIMVRCAEPGKVYSALSRCMYEQGTITSQIPEISGAFLRCVNMDALVEMGYSYLDNPFAVHDSGGNLLAYSRQAGLRDAAWLNGAALETLFDFHSVDNAAGMEQSRRDQMPVILNSKSGVPQMRMSLSSRGQIFGYLTVVAQFHPFTSADLQVAELLGCFITLDLQRQSSIAKTSVSEAGQLKRFLEFGDRDAPEMPQWLEKQHCPPGSHGYLVLLNAAAGRTISLGVDELLSRLDRLFPDAVVTRLEAGIVLFLQCSGSLMQHEGIAAFLEQMSSKLVLGVSMPFTELAESGHAALRQARSALELGMVLHPDKSCYLYEDYSIYAGLHAAALHIDLRELLPPGLRALMDTEGADEALRTLEVYCATGGKKARAAEMLFIHLNTLKYRLGQISQKLNADLDDPATLFSLEYALHIIYYLQSFGSGHIR